jgi:hypothetical protein
MGHPSVVITQIEGFFSEALVGNVSTGWRHGQILPESLQPMHLVRRHRPKKDDLDLRPGTIPPFDGNQVNLLIDKCYWSGIVFFRQHVTGYWATAENGYWADIEKEYAVESAPNGAK